MTRILLILVSILAGHIGQACAAVTSPLTGLNLNTMSVSVHAPENTDAAALDLYALNILSQAGMTVGNPSAPDAALVIEFGVGSSIKLYELVTGPRGYVDRLATWEMGAAGRDPQADPKDAIRQYLQVFVGEYRAANGITGPSGPTLTLNGGTGAITVAPGATVTIKAVAPSGNAMDWIGIYPVGGPSTTKSVVEHYVAGTAYTIPATTPAGKYEARLFANDSMTLITTSAPITVSTP